MSTQLTLEALDRSLQGTELSSADITPAPEVTIDHRNRDVAHWFNATVDGKEVFVYMTKGGEKGKTVTQEHRARMEAVVVESAAALRVLLSSPQSHNNMLSIAGKGNYLAGESGRTSQEFAVHYAGRSILEAQEPVRSFVERIRTVIES
jgi:spore germination protein GerM